MHLELCRVAIIGIDTPHGGTSTGIYKQAGPNDTSNKYMRVEAGRKKGSLCYEHMMVVKTFVSRCRETEMSAIVYSVYLALSYVILLLWYCPIFSLFMS